MMLEACVAARARDALESRIGLPPWPHGSIPTEMLHTEPLPSSCIDDERLSNFWGHR